MADFMGRSTEEYNPLERFLNRLQELQSQPAGAAILPQTDGVRKVLDKVQVPLGPFNISMDNGKITGGSVGDGILASQQTGGEAQNKKSGSISYNPNTRQFEFNDGNLTIGYGGPRNWQVSQTGPIGWKVGPGMIQVDRDGVSIGRSDKKGLFVQYNKQFKF